MLKVGITGASMDTSSYTRQRYGYGTEKLFGRKFYIPIRELERRVEQPILRILKTRHDICEIVTSKKEHFWVKEEDVPRFIKLVKTLIKSQLH